MIVLDTYAWIEYFIGSEQGKITREHLRAENTFTPSIVLAELSRKYLREGISEKEILTRLNFISAKTTITHIDAELSLSAARAYLELYEAARRNRQRSPSLADGIVLATARALNTKLLTGDEHFRGLPDTQSMS